MFLNFFKRAVSFQNNNSGEKKEEMEIAKEALAVEESEEQTVFKETIYDIIRTIKDPEKPATLEFLQVVYEEGVYILPRKSKKDPLYVEIEFNPTVPHCSLANLIGLCIRAKLKQCLPEPIKLKIYIKKGAHDTEKEINKLINDKERVAAAMENPNLREIVEKCIKEDDY